MKRRELIRLISLATGSALVIPLSSNLLIACKQVEKQEELDYALQFFNQEDFSLVRDLVDVILPKTESPSASDVGVHQIIDTMIGKVYDAEQQLNFTDKFSKLKAYLGTSENYSDSLESLITSYNKEDQEAKSAFLNLKQQTVLYYLSTKEIGTTYLNYLPVPGEYKACIKLEEVNGKAWAL